MAVRSSAGRCSRDGDRRELALELLFVVVPYLLTVTHFAMWWAGWSPPARFFAPMLAAVRRASGGGVDVQPTPRRTRARGAR